jgi:hypothetical protein
VVVDVAGFSQYEVVEGYSSGNNNGGGSNGGGGGEGGGGNSQGENLFSNELNSNRSEIESSNQSDTIDKLIHPIEETSDKINEMSFNSKQLILFGLMMLILIGIVFVVLRIVYFIRKKSILVSSEENPNNF